ncbi:hypothetical protein BH18ACT11_BH18ACT11_14130 [soil metagenome]
MTELVQAAISVIGFPATREELEGFLEVDEKSGKVLGGATDLDLVLDFERHEYVTWTAPRWMTQGDLLLFYHTKNARQKVNTLLAEAEGRLRELSRRGRWRIWGRGERERHRLVELVALLKGAAASSDKYSGTIFACAEISAPPGYEGQEVERHFAGRSFAPLGRVQVFDNPLPADQFVEFVKIGQGTANTPLYERQFEGIKRQLSEHNALPTLLGDVRIGGTSFREVDKDSWPAISCSPSTRFINEEQLRSYLLDFLLEEIKDERTPLLRECKCVRGGKKTGFADYFIKVGGTWVPVEAKLNVLSTPEQKLLDQVAKYLCIDTFSPTVGTQVGKTYGASGTSLCLIGDQAGIYTVSHGEFVGCSPGDPLWHRGALDHGIVPEIRAKVEEVRGS